MHTKIPCTINTLSWTINVSLIYGNSWVSLEPFSVILSGGQPKMYWWLYCTGASKSHEIAHICCKRQGQHIQWKFFSAWWQCIDLELTPSVIYDATWNPRIGRFRIYFNYCCYCNLSFDQSDPNGAKPTQLTNQNSDTVMKSETLMYQRTTGKIFKTS